MNRRLEGRVAIVTGGAGFLGSHHCRRLAQEGASVVVADVANGQAVVEDIRTRGGTALFMELDVTDPDNAQQVAGATLEAFGQIDILINNAGLTQGMIKPWTDFTIEDWDRKLGIDLKGSFICARAVFPAMRTGNYGKIVNIASQTVVSAPPYFLAHVSAKAGIVGFTRALATEVGQHNINVNAILVGGFFKDPQDERIRLIIERQSIKRPPEPADLSSVVAFLASDEARWITGQTIAVTGGAVRTGG